jgi:hypothetical protein
MYSPDPDKNNLKAAIDQADFLLVNNNSLEELHEEIDRILVKAEKRNA